MFFGIFKKKPKKRGGIPPSTRLPPLHHLKIPNQKIRGE